MDRNKVLTKLQNLAADLGPALALLTPVLQITIIEHS